MRKRTNQVGGDHYSSMTIQPFDIIDEYGLNYYEGNVLKYLLRHRRKNGLEDLKKAKDYIDVLIDKYESTNNREQSDNEGTYTAFGYI